MCSTFKIISLDALLNWILFALLMLSIWIFPGPNAAAANAYQQYIFREWSCKHPRPKLIHVQNNPDTTLTPHCVVLHRCGSDTGCCDNASTCFSVKSEIVNITLMQSQMVRIGSKVMKLKWKSLHLEKNFPQCYQKFIAFGIIETPLIWIEIRAHLLVGKTSTEDGDGSKSPEGKINLYMMLQSNTEFCNVFSSHEQKRVLRMHLEEFPGFWFQFYLY